MSPELDVLADLPPERFVAARDALAKRLKAEGDAGGAAEVRRLRRPTVPQWVTDQVRRHHRDVVDSLREASGAVADAQEAAITRGERDALREANDRRRQAVVALRGAVEQVLAEHGRPAHHRDEVLQAIESALIAEVTSDGFGLRDDFQPPDRDLDRTQEEAPGAVRTDERTAEAGAEAQAEAQRRQAEARRRRAEARSAVEEAAARVRRARLELDRAEAELEAASNRLRGAEGQA